MAVVVNEFEVIPAEPQASQPAASRQEAAPAGKPKDPERELDRMLHQRRARALRLTAV